MVGRVSCLLQVIGLKVSQATLRTPEPVVWQLVRSSIEIAQSPLTRSIAFVDGIFDFPFDLGLVSSASINAAFGVGSTDYSERNKPDRDIAADG
jgi:hypothetical protein